MNDPLKPDTKILSSLGSITRHCEEYFSATGSILDVTSIKSLLSDSDLQSWMREMDKMSLLPIKR